MGIAALEGYEGSNGRTMDLWEKVSSLVPSHSIAAPPAQLCELLPQIYPDGSLGIALTDTFTTRPFFDDFVANPERARRWKGLRQDSGDPIKFIPMAKEAFEKVGADPKTSTSWSLQILLVDTKRTTNLTVVAAPPPQRSSCSPMRWTSTAVSSSSKQRTKPGSGPASESAPTSPTVRLRAYVYLAPLFLPAHLT